MCVCDNYDKQSTLESRHVDLAVVVDGDEQGDAGHSTHRAVAERVVASDDLQPRQRHDGRIHVGVDGHVAADVADALGGPRTIN